VAVFEYSGTIQSREDRNETGTIDAHSEHEAREKLKLLRLSDVKIKRVGGLKGLIGKWTADIR